MSIWDRERVANFVCVNMAVTMYLSYLKIFLLLFLLNGLAASDVQVVTTENFTVVLEGEWMLEL